MQKRATKKTGLLQYYFVLILTMIVMAAVSFITINKTIYQKVIDERKTQIEHGIRTLEGKKDVLKQSVNRLYYNMDTLHLMRKHRIKAEDQVELLEYSHFLSLTSLQEEWIENYFLYFPNSGLVFDKDQIFMSMDDMYQNFFQIEGLDFSAFMESIGDFSDRILPECSLVENGRKTSVLPYILHVNNDEKLILVAFLNLQHIEEILNLSTDQNIYEIWYQGESLYNTGVSEQAVQAAKSDRKGDRRQNSWLGDVLLKCRDTESELEVWELVRGSFLRNVMINLIQGYILVILVVTIGCSLALFLVDRFFNSPKRKMAERFAEQGYAVCNYHINRLLESYTADDELQDAIQYLHLDEEKQAVACIIRDLQKNQLGDRIEQLYEKAAAMFDDQASIQYLKRKGSSTVVLIYNMKNPELILAGLEKLVNDMNTEWRYPVYLAIGSCYENARGICISYLEAKKVMDYHKNYPDSKHIRYSQLPMVDSFAMPGVESKNKLQVLCMSGETEKAVSLFTEIFEQTGKAGFVLNPVSAHIFTVQIAGILLSCIEDQTEKEAREELMIDVSKLFSLSDYEDFAAQVAEVIRKIGVYAQKHKKEAHAAGEKMLEYVRINFRDPDLSLVQMGEVFGMSSGYLSQYFKQHTGKNFSQYLETLRIGEAVRLLEESGKSINEIMNASGYTNRNTFYKAFLRAYGISPSAYKENILKQKK